MSEDRTIPATGTKIIINGTQEYILSTPRDYIIGLYQNLRDDYTEYRIGLTDHNTGEYFEILMDNIKEIEFKDEDVMLSKKEKEELDEAMAPIIPPETCKFVTIEEFKIYRV